MNNKIANIYNSKYYITDIDIDKLISKIAFIQENICELIKNIDKSIKHPGPVHDSSISGIHENDIELELTNMNETIDGLYSLNQLNYLFERMENNIQILFNEISNEERVHETILQQRELALGKKNTSNKYKKKLDRTQIIEQQINDMIKQ